MPRYKLTNNTDYFNKFVKMTELHPEIKNRVINLLDLCCTREAIYDGVLRMTKNSNGLTSLDQALEGEYQYMAIY